MFADTNADDMHEGTLEETTMYVTHGGKALRLYLVALVFMASVALVSGCSTKGPAEIGAHGQPEAAEFEMPIELRNADAVGSVQFDLMYDPDVLRLLEVLIGEKPSTTMVDFNTDSVGRAVIGIVDEEGIDGDALSLSVRFSILQKGAGSSLTIENVVAYDAATVSPVSASPMSGEFGADTGLVTPPVLAFES